MPESNAVQLLTRISAGDRTAIPELVPEVYDRLRAIASRFFQRERADHTLQPTALVNEAYLQLVERTDLDWSGRTHFLAIAASEMRRILVDHARRKHAQKRGGGMHRVTLEGVPEDFSPRVDLLDIHEALERLAGLDERAARVVELRFFAGMSMEEVAAVLGVTSRTIRDDWRTARAWLRTELER
jgi:RNA polymerase sigma factor (TIGR02999 family)